MNSQNQSQTQNDIQNVPQQASHTVFFNDQPRATLELWRILSIFSANKT